MTPQPRQRMGKKQRSMGVEPSPSSQPLDVVSQNVWFRPVYLLFWATYLTALWFVLGPSNPWYAISVAWATCAVVPAVPVALMRRVPRRWFRVPAGERVLHRLVGVGVFGWLLDVSGWNRHVLEPLRGFSGTRAGLPALEKSVRDSTAAHGLCFAVHILLAVLALFSSDPLRAALWMLLPGVVVHFYPVLLQRSVMLRLQPLLVKSGS